MAEPAKLKPKALPFIQLARIAEGRQTYAWRFIGPAGESVGKPLAGQRFESFKDGWDAAKLAGWARVGCSARFKKGGARG